LVFFAKLSFFQKKAEKKAEGFFVGYIFFWKKKT